VTSVRVLDGGRVAVAGTIDLHLHSAPSLFERIGDDWTIARAADEAGMRGFVIKAHHESTASRAHFVSKMFPRLSIFGSITLNSYVGGINPAAVDSALRLGAKVVWMPSIDSAHHEKIYGTTGSYGWQSGGRQGVKGISILAGGELLGQVHEVLKLIAEKDAILATGHLSEEEIRLLVPAAREHGVEKIIITHPFSRASGHTLELCVDMVELGALIEIEWTGISPMSTWEGESVEQLMGAIGRLGAENCVLVSDAGQRHSPMPPEALRILAQCLFEKGLNPEELGAMTIDNPKALLGID